MNNAPSVIDETEDPFRYETIIAENMTFEDFLTHFSQVHAEWLSGKVFLIVNNVPHNAIIGFLYSLLNLYLGFQKIGRVYLAGVAMYLGDDKPAREPDVLVILNENQARIRQTHIEGPADIAVEVVSPESLRRDRGDKFVEYEAAGVGEYWLIDPLHREALFYRLDTDGRYERIEPGEDGRLASTLLPGFALNPALLWQDELPAGPELIALVEAML